MHRILLALCVLVSPSVALAAGEIGVVSEMFVEKTVVQPNGTPKTLLVTQKSGPPGTRLLFTHSYHNASKVPVANFGMTNPMPAGVDFFGSDDASATVSVDGGKNWGSLGTLKVRGADGALRAARPEDVTHVRWALKTPIPAGGAGKLSFHGVVK